VRPRTPAEVTFLGLGGIAETFLRLAAAAGTLRLEAELVELVGLEAAWGRPTLLPALERAVRFRARDVRSILSAGAGTHSPTLPGTQLMLSLPAVPERPLAAYALVSLGVGA
jgi:hypothetical protein